MAGEVERRPGGTSLTSEPSLGGPSSAATAPGKRTLTDAAGVDGIPGHVRVTAEHGLRVRKTPDPSSHSNVLGLLHKNAEIEAHGVRGAWLDVFYRAEPAVIHGGFVEPVRPASHGATAPTPSHHAPAPSHHHAPASEHGPLDAHEHAAVVSNGHVPPAPHPAPAPPPGGHPTPAVTASSPHPAATASTGAVAATPPVPPPAGTPTPSPSPSPSTHPTSAAAPAGGTAAAPPPPPAAVPRKPGEFFQRIYTAGSGKNTQQVAVFASPGVTAQPNVFMMLHGHDAQLGIDHDADHQGKSGVLSGIDVAAETTRAAVNTISLVPQGWIGGAGDRGKHEGGYMKALEGGLPAFLDSLLPQVARDLGLPALTPAHIGLAGHSAGGYKGINESLGAAGDLADTVSDVTLMDTDYAPSHFETTAKWLLRKPAEGKPHMTRTLRISESRDQMTAAAAKGFQGAVQVFGDDHFRARAEKAGFTFVPLGTGEQHGSHNVARTHFQLQLHGQVHADVLLLESNRGGRGHHQVRDDILDDSILTVGKGAAATAGYGGENIEGHGSKSLAGLSAAPAGNAAATPGSAAPASSAHAPAKVVHVSEADMHGAVTKAAKPADHTGEATGPAHEAPTDEHHGHAGPKVAAGITADNKANPPPTVARPTKDWIHDTDDATSMMTPRTKALYDKAMETLRAGNLIFPAEDEPAPKTSRPFKAFVASLYGQFGVVERRINNDIMGHGGGKAYSMKGFIESTLADLPKDAIAPGHGRQRMHREMVAAFLKMREAAAHDGVVLLAMSCYREPHANATSKNHYAVATNSSHGYGLAIDLKLGVDAAHTASGQAFGVREINTEDPENLMKYYRSSVMKWMAENGQKFDFHPYFNEPWHFEYNPEGMAAKMVAGAKAWKQQHTEA